MRTLQIKSLSLVFVLTLLLTSAYLPQSAYAATLSQENGNPVSPQPTAGPDQDGDWVSDADEERFGSDPALVDTDGDGLSDFEEIFIWGTEPGKANLDSDHDSIFDEIEKTLFQTDPKAAEPDRDGDLLFDQIELDYQTDPGNPDTDGDLLSDLIEIFLTKSDPRVADPDDDSNGYPDVLQPWLPEHLQDSICQADVIFTINSLTIVDAEEADTLNNVVGGDEAALLYAIQIANSSDPDRAISQAYFDQKLWQGTVLEGSQVTRFQKLKTMSAQCGEIISIGLQAIEDDAPWGGITDMGVHQEDSTLFFRRLPVGWEYNVPSVYVFEGVGIDGSYRYDVEYSLEIALGSVPLARQDSNADSVNPAISSTPQPLILGIGLLRANGEETQPLGRLDDQPTATISGTQLAEEMSITFTPDFALVELLPGDYVIQVNAPPYNPSETPFTVKENHQRLLITLERPPLNFDNLVLLQNAGRWLANYETGEIVATLPNGNGTIMFRSDQPDRFLEILDDNSGFTQKFIEGNQRQELKLPVANGQGRLTSVYLAPDLQRLVYVVTNDLWIAEIDWNSFQLVNERQVTHNGIFRNRVYYYSWYEDTILANVQNRVVRIDLNLGETSDTSVSWYNITERISPDGRIVVSGNDPFNETYDLLSGEIAAIPNFTTAGKKYTIKWITNTLLAIQIGEGADAQIVIYKRDGSSFSEHVGLTGSFFVSIRETLHAPSPSGTYFFAWGDRFINENILINSESGSVITMIPQVLEGNIHWINDTQFFFSRGPRSNRGDVKLEDQGTWLYDIGSQTATKLFSYPYTSMAVLVDQGIAVFVANDNLWQMKLDKFEPIQLTNTGRYRFIQVSEVQTVTLTSDAK